jgi:hypothetical protein
MIQVYKKNINFIDTLANYENKGPIKNSDFFLKDKKIKREKSIIVLKRFLKKKLYFEEVYFYLLQKFIKVKILSKLLNIKSRYIYLQNNFIYNSKLKTN